MIYYLNDGQTIYDSLLQLNPKLRIAYETGKTTKNEERECLRKQYNKGKLDVLILSAIGITGLHFVNTKAEHVFSYEDNETKKQAQGRGTRYNAHKPNKETKEIDPVIIFHYLSVFPEPETIPKGLKDVFLKRFLDKHKEKEDFIDFDFNATFLAKLKGEEDYKTIDEVLEVSNWQKDQALKLPLNRFQLCGTTRHNK